MDDKSNPYARALDGDVLDDFSSILNGYGGTPLGRRDILDEGQEDLLLDFRQSAQKLANEIEPVITDGPVS